MKSKELRIIQPNDMHVHLRDDDVMQAVLPHTARQFGQCIVMPNLKQPIVNVDLALAYYNRIQKAVPAHLLNAFQAYLTLYLTDSTSKLEIEKAVTTNIIKGIKLYPAGATTLSENGVTQIKNCYKVFEAMQKNQMILLIHGEVTQSLIDIFDREAYFIEDVLMPLRKDFPELKISFEHITTKQAVDYVIDESSPYLAASITPQHLLYNRNHMLAGGIRPHYYCLPILKRSEHQQSLLKAASSGLPYFYAGTDSAPHLQANKENACGCAGCYTAFHAIELYAKAFDSINALDKLEGFMSIFGAQFYGLDLNKQHTTIIAQEWTIPENLPCAGEYIVPLAANERLNWKVVYK
jgi:dihydroorotase